MSFILQWLQRFWRYREAGLSVAQLSSPSSNSRDESVISIGGQRNHLNVSRVLILPTLQAGIIEGVGTFGY